jgi:hypothetical protein
MSPTSRAKASCCCCVGLIELISVALLFKNVFDLRKVNLKCFLIHFLILLVISFLFANKKSF